MYEHHLFWCPRNFFCCDGFFVLLFNFATDSPICVRFSWCCVRRVEGWRVPLSRRFPSCLSPLFRSESWCEAFDVEISFIHAHILVHLHVNKINFHMKAAH